MLAMERRYSREDHSCHTNIINIVIHYVTNTSLFGIWAIQITNDLFSYFTGQNDKNVVLDIQNCNV